VALGIFRMASSRVRASPFRIILLCCICGGLAGGLLDIDHIPKALGWRPPVVLQFISPDNLEQGRNLHGLALVVGGTGCACAGGYLLLMVLKWVADSALARLLKKHAPEGIE
jgi:hypothetical protein